MILKRVEANQIYDILHGKSKFIGKTREINRK